MMLQNLGIDPSFQMPAPQTGGMFGGGDSKWKNALMAAVAGLMARRSPTVSNNIINGMQDAQTLKQKIALAKEQRAQQMQDQLALHQQERQFDISNPMPTQPTEFERLAQAGGYAPGSDQYKDLARRKAEAMANPIVMTPYGPMPYSAVTGSQQLPTRPVGPLTPIPDGGPTPQASGGFPY